MSKSEIDVWRAEAGAIPEEKSRLGMPMSVLTSEAVNVAAFVRERWESVIDPVTKEVRIPGLKQAQKKGDKGTVLKKSLEGEILSLEKATQEGQVQFLLQSRGGHGDGSLAERGVFVLSEIKDSLEWLFDDGVDDENDEALKHVEDEHTDDGDNLDDLAQALDDFGALAAANREGLSELGTFDIALVDEAPKLAASLRQPAQRGHRGPVAARPAGDPAPAAHGARADGGAARVPTPPEDPARGDQQLPARQASGLAAAEGEDGLTAASGRPPDPC